MSTQPEEKPKEKEFRASGLAFVRPGRGKGVFKRKFSMMLKATSLNEAWQKLNSGSYRLPANIPIGTRVTWSSCSLAYPEPKPLKNEIKPGPSERPIAQTLALRVTPEAERLLRKAGYYWKK